MNDNDYIKYNKKEKMAKKKVTRERQAKRTAKKKAEFLIALEEKAGNISKACKAINIGRMTYYDWLESDKEFAKAVEEVNEALIDWGEDALKARMQAGDTTAIIFFLKTKGKKRGYVEKQELDHSGQMTIILSDEFLPIETKKKNG